MALCSRCGADAGGAVLCPRCGAAIAGVAAPPYPVGPPASAIPVPQEAPKGRTNAALKRLGLQGIQGFSLRAFFSDVFGKHDPDAVERALTLGGPDTTPAVVPEMATMPHPWIFARVLLAFVISFVMLYLCVALFRAANAVPGTIFLAAFAMPVALMILFYELNTPRNVSIVRVLEVFIAGGALALLFTLVLDQVIPGSPGGPLAFGVGIAEESAKLAALLVALRFVHRERYPYRLNGLLLGASIGAGFASFETAGYLFNALLANQGGGLGAMLGLAILRAVSAPGMHVAWTAIAAAAYWRVSPLRARPSEAIRSGKFWVLFAVPVVMHGLWDWITPLWPLYLVIEWVVLISLIQTGLREVGRAAEGEANPWKTVYLPPVLAAQPMMTMSGVGALDAQSARVGVPPTPQGQQAVMSSVAAVGQGSQTPPQQQYGPPPTWYPDPWGQHESRYWDGQEWTAYVADAGQVSMEQ